MSEDRVIKDISQEEISTRWHQEEHCMQARSRGPARHLEIASGGEDDAVIYDVVSNETMESTFSRRSEDSSGAI